jgi:hypothetical protein
MLSDIPCVSLFVCFVLFVIVVVSFWKGVQCCRDNKGTEKRKRKKKRTA